MIDSKASAHKIHYVKLHSVIVAMLVLRSRKMEERIITEWYIRRFPKTRMPLFTEVTAFARVYSDAVEKLNATA